jgi:hypothetical protein
MLRSSSSRVGASGVSVRYWPVRVSAGSRLCGARSSFIVFHLTPLTSVTSPPPTWCGFPTLSVYR